MQQKLLKFLKYLRRQRITPYIKKNIILHFYYTFIEELKDTEEGKKWIESLD